MRIRNVDDSTFFCYNVFCIIVNIFVLENEKKCQLFIITTETIGKICKVLGCQADDIMEFVEK